MTREEMSWDEAESVLRQLSKELRAAEKGHIAILTAREAAAHISKLTTDKDQLSNKIEQLKASVVNTIKEHDEKLQAQQKSFDAKMQNIANDIKLKEDAAQEVLRISANAIASKLSEDEALKMDISAKLVEKRNTIKRIDGEVERLKEDHDNWKRSLEIERKEFRARAIAQYEEEMRSLNEKVSARRAELERMFQEAVGNIRSGLPSV
jgi:D-arabinose 1-dehydrogenase-like Zn-dependent alcohol dehydrogenase